MLIKMYIVIKMLFVNSCLNADKLMRIGVETNCIVLITKKNHTIDHFDTFVCNVYIKVSKNFFCFYMYTLKISLAMVSIIHSNVIEKNLL